MIRDHYLSKRSAGWRASFFDVLLLIVSVASFAYGFMLHNGEEGSALMVVGYILGLLASVRYIVSGMSYAPHIRSLIQKYDKALNKTPSQEG